ncbi:hypothetical protein [Streptomyces sp. N35]|uniref:hypothetical protein n=1 Tax=Streptomyces sp. N35 TaxID=2795730 RepID=UPI0018F4F7E8|nr:hypothetical protein [Streptomyces sp. N35]
MRVTRRAIRAAAVSTGAVAALAVPAGAVAALALPAGTAYAASGSAASGSAQESDGTVPDGTRITMPDGRTARFVHGGADGLRVDIAMPNGGFLGSVDPRSPSTVNDGWTYQLVRDGRAWGGSKFVVKDGRGGCSWVYDMRGRLLEKHSADKNSTGKRSADRSGGARASSYKSQVTTPLGGVRAGAQEQQPSRPVSAPLVAAGGGIAAAGAAGLGFAVLRRRAS